jgi:hypothetical protein
VRLNDENLEKLAGVRATFPRKKRRRQRRGKAYRELVPSEFADASPGRRERLRDQGVRGHPRSPLFPPGLVLSVELECCSHRSRIEVLACGRIPARASCRTCRRWSDTLPETARHPLPNATRTVVSERVEEREGRAFRVQVLATPRRARLVAGEDPAANGH